VITTVGVVVPAADEQDLIGGCLRALDRAREHLVRRRPLVSTRVVVVLDACRDDTAGVVGRHPGTESLALSSRCVGVARAAGVAHLLRTAAARSGDVWLASTDADSQVPVDWLSGMLELAERGAQLVLGTVLPGPELQPAQARTWLSQHVLREDHPHIHGANLGIRADAYGALGGWPALTTGEDVALGRRAVSTGHLQIVRTAAYPVRTSARPTGRAPRGFSSYLRDLERQRAAV
jgi:hypothetical protein